MISSRKVTKEFVSKIPSTNLHRISLKDGTTIQENNFWNSIIGLNEIVFPKKYQKKKRRMKLSRLAIKYDSKDKQNAPETVVLKLPRSDAKRSTRFYYLCESKFYEKIGPLICGMKLPSIYFVFQQPKWKYECEVLLSRHPRRRQNPSWWSFGSNSIFGHFTCPIFLRFQFAWTGERSI